MTKNSHTTGTPRKKLSLVEFIMFMYVQYGFDFHGSDFSFFAIVAFCLPFQ